MNYLDARRLTGPNLLWNKPGSILDVSCSEADVPEVVDAWTIAVRRMLDAVGWADETLCVHQLSGGVSLAFSAPIDALYAATEINEWAWSVVSASATGESVPDFDEKADELRRAIDEEINPALLTLEHAAIKHNVAFLWDDDDVSIGMGTGSRCWPFRELPEPGSIDWSGIHDIPAGIVTGTNGKTTTVRLATHICRVANRHTGVSCTDWIAVDDRIIDRGDWSGPGGARNVLRQADVEVAILETARGGLLRRGLGLNRADAALITNIAEDHLGDFGSQNLDELLDIKWVVSRAVESGGVLILNADDDRLVSKSSEFSGDIVWFSLRPENEIVRQHRGRGGLAFIALDNALVKAQGEDEGVICKIDDVSITMGGAARHNVANALAAAALTDALGIALTAIGDGLRSVTQEDNPGRCNVYEVDGARVLVDFAHNPQAMQALFDMATALPARRRLLAFGQAGDRPDSLIQELARGAWDIGLDAVVVSELEMYHRGREHGEVYALIRDELLRNGADAGQIRHFEEEAESLDFALDWAEPGDLVIMLALGSGQAIQERLTALAAEN